MKNIWLKLKMGIYGVNISWDINFLGEYGLDAIWSKCNLNKSNNCEDNEVDGLQDPVGCLSANSCTKREPSNNMATKIRDWGDNHCPVRSWYNEWCLVQSTDLLIDLNALEVHIELVHGYWIGYVVYVAEKKIGLSLILQFMLLTCLRSDRTRHP